MPETAHPAEPEPARFGLGSAEGRALVVLATIIGLCFLWMVVWPLLAPLVLAALVVMLFDPLHRRIERRLGGSSIGAATVSMLSLCLLVATPAVGVGLLLIAQARSVLLELLADQPLQSRLTEMLEYYARGALLLIRRVAGPEVELDALAQEVMRRGAMTFYEALPDVLGHVGRFTLGLIIIAVVVFTLLLRGRPLLKAAIEALPLANEHGWRIARRLGQTVRAVFVGSVLTALLQGALGAASFWVTGFSNFLVWGALVALAAFVPFVGTALVWGPAVLYLVVTGHGRTALALLVAGLVISTVDNLVRPLLIHLGVRESFHPVLLFLALLGGLQTMGPMGLIYGPLVAACLVEVVRIYQSEVMPPRSEPRPGFAPKAPAAAQDPGGDRSP